MRAKKGFTLVEILIVVVILGILAAIVIPQFSEASTEAKLNSSLSSLQSLRSQISLYKIQHNDKAPTLTNFAAQLEQYSDADGGVSPTKNADYPYGPYVQRVPNNPWNNKNGVAPVGADSADVGWIYDEGTGNIYLAITAVPEDTAARQTLIDNGAALGTTTTP